MVVLAYCLQLGALCMLVPAVLSYVVGGVAMAIDSQKYAWLIRCYFARAHEYVVVAAALTALAVPFLR